MRTSIVLLAALLCVDALITMPPATATRGAHPFIAGAVSSTPPRVATTPNNAHPSRTIVPRLSLLTTASSAVLGAASFVARLPAPVLLALAVASEIGGTTSLKLAATSSPLWSICVFICYALCFTLLPLALRTLPLSVAYATWSGAGTVASVFIGALIFSEKITPFKLFCLSAIVFGIVGINH